MIESLGDTIRTCFQNDCLVGWIDFVPESLTSIGMIAISLHINTRRHPSSSPVKLSNKRPKYPKLTATSHVGDEPEP